MPDTRFKLRMPRPLLVRMQAAAAALGPETTLSGVACRCLRRWRRAGMPPVSGGVAAAETCPLATRAGSVPLSLEIPAELVFRLTPTEIRTAIRFALDEVDGRRPAPPIEIDPRDAEVPYKVVEEPQ